MAVSVLGLAGRRENRPLRAFPPDSAQGGRAQRELGRTGPDRPIQASPAPGRVYGGACAGQHLWLALRLGSTTLPWEAKCRPTWRTTRLPRAEDGSMPVGPRALCSANRRPGDRRIARSSSRQEFDRPWRIGPPQHRLLWSQQPDAALRCQQPAGSALPTKQANAGGGGSSRGRSNWPDAGWIARCVDPQGALFALQECPGSHRHRAVSASGSRVVRQVGRHCSQGRVVAAQSRSASHRCLSALAPP